MHAKHFYCTNNIFSTGGLCELSSESHYTSSSGYIENNQQEYCVIGKFKKVFIKGRIVKRFRVLT